MKKDEGSGSGREKVQKWKILDEVGIQSYSYQKLPYNHIIMRLIRVIDYSLPSLNELSRSSLTHYSQPQDYLESDLGHAQIHNMDPYIPSHLANLPLNTQVKVTQKLLHLVELDPDMQARPPLHQAVSAQSLRYPQVEYPLSHLADIFESSFSCVFGNPGIYHVSRAHNHGNNYHLGLTGRCAITRQSRIPTATTETKITKGIQLFLLSSVIFLLSVISIEMSKPMLELQVLSSGGKGKQRCRILQNIYLGTIMTAPFSNQILAAISLSDQGKSVAQCSTDLG